jgi:hypothetical protein
VTSNLSSEIEGLVSDEVPFFNNRNGIQQRPPGFSPTLKTYTQSEHTSLRQTGQLNDRKDSVNGQTVPEFRTFKQNSLMNTTAFTGQVFSMRS